MYLSLGIVVWAMGLAAQAPQLDWSFETQGKIYASPILADLDGDGRSEVIVCASRDRRVLCLDCDGELRWDYGLEDTFADGIPATPSVLDYDGDGKQEVFFVTAGGVAGCLDYQGRPIWRTFTGDRTDYSGPTLADVDHDGRIEVLFGSDSGTLYCLDDCGQERWHYQGDGQIRGIPAVAWHAASGTMRVYVTFGGGGSACLSSKGEVVWAFDEPLPKKERRSGPAIGDVDGDGQLEVVLATEDFRVIVRDAFTGVEKWRWKGLHSVDQTSSFALVDFDGSGRLDIVCADGSGQGGAGAVYRLRDGQPLWTADVGGSVVQGPSVGDVNGDGLLEVLVCSRSRRMVCLSAEGVEQWSVPSATEVLTTPALGDIDGDGQVEIVFTSKDRFVRCMTAGGAYDPAKMPWPMMGHDAQLSNNALGAPFTATAPTPSAEVKPDLSLTQFAPLRMGDNTVAFTFTNNSARPRRLEAAAEVTRPDGSRVSWTVTGRREAFETKTAEFVLPVLASGAYVMRLRLLDAGAGEMLVTQDHRCDVEAFATEKETLAAQFDEAIERIKGDIPTNIPWALQSELAMISGTQMTPALRERTTAALNQAHADVETAIASAAALSGATPKERRTGADAVRAAMREFQRTVARFNAACATPGSTEDFGAVVDTTLRKVFRDEPYLVQPRRLPEPEVALARNEYEGLQLVIVPLWRDLKGLTVSASALTRVVGGGCIPAEDITINRVGYVEIGPSEYNWKVDKQGFYPDVLFPNSPVDVPAGQDAQPYFITFRTRPGTPPGTYDGTISVSANGAAPLDIRLAVQVWDFAIPEKPNLKVSLWMDENYLRRFYKYEDRTPLEVRQRYYDYYLEHRASPVRAFPVDGSSDLVEDFDYVMAHGQNCFFISLPEYLEAPEREVFAGQLRATRDLLAAKSWADKAIIYTRDEVAVMGRHLIPKVVEMNNWVKTVMPEWPRIQTSAPEQALFDAVDIWCPCIDHFDPVVLAERQAKGDRLWFYTVWGRPGIMIEFPATDHRLMFWECWKYGAEGFLYWGTTHWDLNVQGDARWPDVPWVTYNRQPGHNGCGYLLYPGPDGTPLGSIRFEALRDGIEDYEYLYLLRSLWNEKSGRTRAGTDEYGQFRARVEAELAVDPSVVKDNETFTEDPTVILDARERIAGLIEALQALD